MSDTGTDKITVSCDCGAKLRVGRGAIGKRGRCPKCQNVFVVSDPDESIPIAGENEFDLLAQAVAEQGSAPAISQPERPSSTLRCPSCGAAMAPNAVLCIECGHNTQTGKSAKGASLAKTDGVVKRMAGGTAPFLLGCGLSGVGALVGAAIWFGIAMWSGVEFAYIAWGLGGLAGLGMVIGYPERNQKAGFAAAGIALFGIGMAKVFIVVFVISVLISGDTNNAVLQKSFLAAAMADEELDNADIWDEDERDERWDAAFDRALADVEKMPASVFDRKWQEYRDDLEFENAYQDESGAERMRVAYWQADRKADADGVAYGSQIRESMYKESYRTVKTYNDEQLAQAVADVEAWQERDKSDDPDFIRTQLVYALTNEEVQKRNEGREEYWQPSDQDWKTMFDEKAVTVDAMPPEDRAAAWKARQAEVERDEKIERVVEHETHRRTLREGARFDDERWETITIEEEEKCRAMSPEELDARIADIDAWDEGGMWEDSDYLRDQMIDQHVTDAVMQRRDQSGDDGGLWRPSSGEREQLRAEAIAFVDSVPPDQYRQHLEERQREAQQKWAERMASLDEEQSAEAVGAFAAMFADMFGPIDLLFIGLALFTAYRLASGSQSE